MKKWYSKQAVTIRAAIISGIFVIVASIVPAGISLIREFVINRDSAVKLVDITIIETDKFPKLDIKVRNTGEKIAFLKKAVFHVKKIWILKHPYWPAAQPATWEYSVMLPIEGAPYVVEGQVSQSLSPNSVDRFTFLLGNDAPPDIKDYVYLLKLELIYDEDNKSIVSDNVLFIASSPAMFLGLSSTNKLRKETFEYNKSVAREIYEIEGIKSKRLRKTLKELL